MQKVRIYLKVGGDYCAFHEMSFRVVYDITNNKKFSEYTCQELEEWDYNEQGGGYSDVIEADAYLIDGKYYYNI